MKSILKYLLFFFIAFTIAGSVGYYTVRMFTQSAAEIILPKLRGKNIIYVLETLTNMGLNAKLYGTQYDDFHPRYAVISQDPKPGTTIKKGRDVIIYLSKGKKENILPDLRQVSLEQASIILEENEFLTGQIAYTFENKTPENHIITQYPMPFSTALKGSACHLLVSKGARSPQLIMPDLSGARLENASTLIEKSDLKIKKIVSRIDPSASQGIVLNQHPDKGSMVTRDTPVSLVVNDSISHRQITPDHLNGVIFLTHTLAPGFLKYHVRVEIDMFGTLLNLYDEYMMSGEDIPLLVPSGMKTKINFYIDHQWLKTIFIDPWDKNVPFNINNFTGEDNLWELSPPPSYLQISPDWEKN